MWFLEVMNTGCGLCCWELSKVSREGLEREI